MVRKLRINENTVREDFDLNNCEYSYSEQGYRIYKDVANNTFIAVPEDGGKPFEIKDNQFKPYYIVATFKPTTNKEIYRDRCDTLQTAEKTYNDTIKSLTSYPRKKGDDVKVAMFKITLDKPQEVKSCTVTSDGIVGESTKKSFKRTSSLKESDRARDVMDDVLYKFNHYLYGKKWGQWGDYTIDRVDLYGEDKDGDYISAYVKVYEDTPEGKIRRINVTPQKFSFKITDENYNDYDKELYKEIDKWLATRPV